MRLDSAQTPCSVVSGERVVSKKIFAHCAFQIYQAMSIVRPTWDLSSCWQMLVNISVMSDPDICSVRNPSGDLNCVALSREHRNKRCSTISGSWSQSGHIGLTWLIRLCKTSQTGIVLCITFHKNKWVRGGTNWVCQRIFQWAGTIPVCELWLVTGLELASRWSPLFRVKLPSEESVKTNLSGIVGWKV